MALLSFSNHDLLLVGDRFCYVATARNGSLGLSANNADQVDTPRILLRALPVDQWHVIARLILALERSDKSNINEHPLEFGTSGDDRWVIA